MKLFTSFYSSGHVRDREHAPIRTSLGHPRFKLTYKIAGKLPLLTPERRWLGMERETYQPLYIAKLEAAGVDKIRLAISELAGKQPAVLLCFEDLSTDGAWCHRQMFARWWEKKTGEPVPEL